MIILKEWNSFDYKTREAILDIVGSSVTIFNREYHHNFDFDVVGKKLKQILGYCYKQPDNTIKVCVTITPTYTPKTSTHKPVVEKHSTPVTKTYICCYEEEIHDKNGNVVDYDIFKEWCDATNEAEARYYFENEHPNNRIIDIL